MRFFDCFTPKIGCDQIHLLYKQSGDQGFGLRRGKLLGECSIADQDGPWKGFSTSWSIWLWALLATYPKPMGFQWKHPFLQVGNKYWQQRAQQWVQARQKKDEYLACTELFYSVPTRIGCSFPIQKKNEVVVMIFGLFFVEKVSWEEGKQGGEGKQMYRMV